MAKATTLIISVAKDKDVGGWAEGRPVLPGKAQ